MDNCIFNVNGCTKEDLKIAIDLALRQRHPPSNGSASTAKGWKFLPDAGLVLYWHCSPEDGVNSFLAPLSAEAITPMVLEWLKSDEAMSMKFEGWDADMDHDGHNTLGWRVYKDDWGKINSKFGSIPYSICAIRPAYMWHGK